LQQQVVIYHQDIDNVSDEPSILVMASKMQKMSQQSAVQNNYERDDPVYKAALI
jgi:hypothetical protein